MLEPRPLDTPRRKRFPVDLDADEWGHGSVAVLDDEVRGFIAWDLEAWNQRRARVGATRRLYRGTSSNGETAVYMARLIDSEGAVERAA